MSLLPILSEFLSAIKFFFSLSLSETRWQIIPSTNSVYMTSSLQVA